MGGGRECALHFIISNSINEKVKLSPQSEYFLTVGRNLDLEIKSIHCKYVRNHSEKYTLLKKISISWKRFNPLNHAGGQHFIFVSIQKHGLQKYYMHLNGFCSSGIRLKFNSMQPPMILFRISAFAVNSVGVVQQRPSYVSVSPWR